MTRGVAPVVGVVMLLGVTVVVGTGAGFMTLGMATPSSPPTATFTGSADAETDRIVLTHQSGDSVVVSDLTVRLAIDGEELARQPPVPFFAAAGFEGGPTGPFNSASADRWRTGETAGLQLAGTNDPALTPGAAVTITLMTDAGVIDEITVTAT